jgi:hypothetical protein
MAIITRPIKTGGGTDYVAGNDALAQEFNADANVIYNDYNGNIKNVNCATDMGLDGTKLADSPNGIVTAKINDGQVTNAKLATDAVTAVKVAALAIIHPKVKTANFDWAPGGILGANNSNSISTGITPTTGTPLRIELVRNGTPDGTISINAILIIWLNSNTNTYHISIGANGAQWDTTGIIIRMVYIPNA